MKFNPSFQLRNVCGEHVLVATGADFVDFNRLISLNDAALDIYQAFAQKDFQPADVEAFLQTNYADADPETVAKDVANLLASFQQERIVIA